MLTGKNKKVARNYTRNHYSLTLFLQSDFRIRYAKINYVNLYFDQHNRGIKRWPNSNLNNAKTTFITPVIIFVQYAPTYRFLIKRTRTRSSVCTVLLSTSFTRASRLRRVSRYFAQEDLQAHNTAIVSCRARYIWQFFRYIFIICSRFTCDDDECTRISRLREKTIKQLCGRIYRPEKLRLRCDPFNNTIVYRCNTRLRSRKNLICVVLKQFTLKF